MKLKIFERRIVSKFYLNSYSSLVVFSSKIIRKKGSEKLMENKSLFKQKKIDAKEIAKIFNKLTEEQKDTMLTVAMGYELLNNRKSKPVIN